MQFREWEEERIGKEYLIPLIGVWDRFEDIPWDELPDQFVLKTTNGCAANIIVKDKVQANNAEIGKRIKLWLSLDFHFPARVLRCTIPLSNPE